MSPPCCRVVVRPRVVRARRGLRIRRRGLRPAILTKRIRQFKCSHGPGCTSDLRGPSLRSRDVSRIEDILPSFIPRSLGACQGIEGEPGVQACARALRYHSPACIRSRGANPASPTNQPGRAPSPRCRSARPSRPHGACPCRPRTSTTPPCTTASMARRTPRSSSCRIPSLRDLGMWDHQIDTLLGLGLRVLRYDSRGHGQSARHPRPLQHRDADRGRGRAARRPGHRTRELHGLLEGRHGRADGRHEARGPVRQARALLDRGVHGRSGDVWAARIEAVTNGGMAAVVDATIDRWFTKAGAGTDARRRRAGPGR